MSARKTPPMTMVERLKIPSWIKQGWSHDEIAARMNRSRESGYLQGKNLPKISPEDVERTADFFAASWGQST